ncbi:uncharacterized protein TA10180 [Theileria annulata]|uniref:Protein phosphatase inhibitor, putative n=1 Tax=Theileria annulata TaxID=5874 RepID=Q4U8U4_THEAN|nr:uncharacterized protein TA10180 [Theileria annulata]CAI76759.1 hypothetical protein, conserved [Theileria annulata]|eukprot:XP_953384.1 hypothetical protein, conserved [Theileria annulata]
MSTITTVETVTKDIEKEVEENSIDSEMGQNCPNSSTQKSVTWDQNTIDNENMNKRSSKSCCIFTGKKGSKTPDSDKETDSDSDTSEDTNCDSH